MIPSPQDQNLPKIQSATHKKKQKQHSVKRAYELCKKENYAVYKLRAITKASLIVFSVIRICPLKKSM